MTDPLQLVRDQYRVPAKKKTTIWIHGVPAEICGATNAGMNLLVRFSGESKIVPVHPTYGVSYKKPS